MNPVYMDNNATTRTAPEVVETMLPYFTELYGNPSSMHYFGGQVEKGRERGEGKDCGLDRRRSGRNRVHILRHRKRQYGRLGDVGVLS